MSLGKLLFDFIDENVMRWGGFDKIYIGILLLNICIIDNIFIVLYIIIVFCLDVK